MLVIPIHGCIGIHMWLRLKPLYPASGTPLSIPVLLHTLALLGYYQGGERTRQLVQDPLWQARHAKPERVRTAAQNAALLCYRKDTLAVLAAMLAVVTLARMRRGYRENRVGTIGLTYPDRIIRVPQGLSLLEASVRNGVPHAHVCGGRGRCSTCRIRILYD
jgi:adenylate cyclase